MNRDLVGSLVFCALGGAGLYGALDLPFGSASVPGPAMQPAALSTLILGLAALQAVRALRKHEPGIARTDASPDPARYRRVGIAALCLAVYVWALGLVGFPIATFVGMWALYALAAEHPLGWRPPVASAILTAATVILFGRLLDVPVPAGTLWQ